MRATFIPHGSGYVLGLKFSGPDWVFRLPSFLCVPLVADVERTISTGHGCGSARIAPSFIKTGNTR